MRFQHLSAVVLLLAFILASGLQQASAQNQRQNAIGMEEIVLDNILARTSIRSYQDRPVEQDKIEKLLRAGMAAPSAVDKRPWHFIVVTDKQVSSLPTSKCFKAWPKPTPTPVWRHVPHWPSSRVVTRPKR